jgi:hypothetical protein
MLAATRRVLRAHPDTLLQETLGLVGVCIVILAALFLPVLA